MVETLVLNNTRKIHSVLRARPLSIARWDVLLNDHWFFLIICIKGSKNHGLEIDHIIGRFDQPLEKGAKPPS